VATGSPSAGTSFYSGNGQLLRFVDANSDGVADGPGQVLATIAPGNTTAVQKIGDLFFILSNNDVHPQIFVKRAGATPSHPLSNVGSIDFTFQSGWWHTVHAMAARPTPGDPTKNDLFFNVGSSANYPQTPAGITVSAGGLIAATLNPDSLYKVTVQDTGSSVNFTNVTQLASGLRNAAGIAVQSGTGDLYFQDNGIDGLVDGNEPLSADELNRITAANIGASIPNFGYSGGYVTYRTGTVVGGGVQPIVAYQPHPNPNTGSESEGMAQIAFTPKSFPPALKNGLFSGFHGKFVLGGTANEENPVVFTDLATGQYFDFISNAEANIAHPDGLLATNNSLFVSDMGNFVTSAHDGAIYQILSLVPLLGNLNADHAVNNFDIFPFELALTIPATFLALNPTVTDYLERGDVNGDGFFDNFDILPFETLLTTGHYPGGAVPEPSALMLGSSGLATLLALCARRNLRSSDS